MARCFIGMGGNLGDVAARFDRALALLTDSGITLTQRSSLYRSAPMGTAAGDAFVNAVAECETPRAPAQILTRLQAAENACDRDRDTIWGPRTIDLDLLYFAGETCQSEGLTVPHPHAWYRRFVLEPMCEIAPDFVHPELAETVSELLARIDRRPLPIFVEAELSISNAEFQQLSNDFPDVRFTAAAADSALCVTASATSGLPAVSLSSIPLPPAEGLRSILEATLGACERIA